MVVPTFFICHAEFVKGERNPDKSGFRSGLPKLNIRGGVVNTTFHNPSSVSFHSTASPEGSRFLSRQVGMAYRLIEMTNEGIHTDFIPF